MELEFIDILDSAKFQSNLVQYSNSFNFKDIVRGAVQNETWRDTTSETLWGILDECGKDINNIVADGAINYVRNISDINTCRIPALASMGGMLSRKMDGLLQLYNTFPRKLQSLIDIFSIDREYLFGGSSQILSIPLIRELMQRMKETILAILPSKRTAYEQIAMDDIFKEFVENNHALDDTTYNKFIHAVFKRFIVDVLSATYSPSDNTTIVDNLLWSELERYKKFSILPESTVIDDYINLRERHPLDKESTTGTNVPMGDVKVNVTYDSLGKQIKALQDALNVSKSFDPWETADYISDHGLSPTHALTQNEILLVEAILNAHNKERFDYSRGIYLRNEIDTRYAYYREREFMNYIGSFIYLYETNINNILIERSLAVDLKTIETDREKRINCLHFYNCVDSEWVYDDEANVNVDERGVNEFIGRKIIGKKEFDDFKSHFIPKVSEDDFYINEDYRMDAGVSDSGEELVRVDHLDRYKQQNVIDSICSKLVGLVNNIRYTRNQLKRQAQFNSMRGTGALLSHAINDYLLTALPTNEFDPIIPRWSARSAYDSVIKNLEYDLTSIANKEAEISENIRLFRNYTNVRIVEYMDTTEYFNIQPLSNQEIDNIGLSKRYWEINLQSITNRDEPQIGVFTANEIRDFYKKNLSMGMLNPSTAVSDDIEEFLITLYESGATDVTYDSENSATVHPINDVANDDKLFAYADGSDRVLVQDNTELQSKQDAQFLRYTGNTDIPVEFMNRYQNSEDLINALNWKNVRYSSVMLHPFLYTFRLWNPLVNIIINAYSVYSSVELERSLTNKYVFDELYGIQGETKNFWKYNILDYSGYVTRYEQEKHSLVDSANEVSPLTGYDGVFYPSAIQRFVDAYLVSSEIQTTDSLKKCLCPRVVIGKDEQGSDVFGSLFTYNLETSQDRIDSYMKMGYEDKETFEQVIASIYWQIEFWNPKLDGFSDEEKRNAAEQLYYTTVPGDIQDSRPYRTYYGQWYSHLGYSSERLRKIAKQLWYWRDRIVDAALHRYSVRNYNLDIGNNSFFLMDTFADEDHPEKEPPVAIQALDFNIAASNAKAMDVICENNNSTAGYCLIDNERPRELWIRWNAEPLAMPAFDVYWDNDLLPERKYDRYSDDNLDSPLGEEQRHDEFGQIQYRDSITNDTFSDVIGRFMESYVIETDKTLMSGNKAPIIYSFEQNADYLVFATWDKRTDSGKFSKQDRTHLTPIHILCRETQDYNQVLSSSLYNLKPFADDLKYIDMVGEPGKREEPYLSAPYITCATRGSIIIPFYRVHSPSSDSTQEDGDDPNNEENSHVLSSQRIDIKLSECICQVVNTNSFESTKKFISYEPKTVYINKEWMFNDTVLISRNTNVVFSVTDDLINQKSFLGFAFMGNLSFKSREQVSRNSAYGCTRYTADSDPVAEIALLRKKFYKAWDKETNDKLYIDGRIYDPDGTILDKKTVLWNSFDRNDKYLCVIRFEKELGETLWNTADPDKKNVFTSRLLNTISDSSYIPNFAYQSPLSFSRFPEVSGVNRLYTSPYFKGKDHWSSQILGLENNLLRDYVKLAQDLIVRDETDNVDTFVNPGVIREAIYRIWEQSDLVSNEGRIEKLYNPQMQLRYPSNAVGDVSEEYKCAVWEEQWKLTEVGKEDFLDRYLTLVRCDSHKNGEILNEKNWIFKTTKIRDILSNVTIQDENEYIKLSLDKFHTEALTNEGKAYGLTSHIMVGTQDPYYYAENMDWPTTLTSPAYLLQYGNGIAGVHRALLRLQLSSATNDSEFPYRATIQVKFIKDRKTDNEPMSVFMDHVNVIPKNSVLMMISQDDTTHLADFHMLTHHNDIFYNIPNPEQEKDANSNDYDRIVSYLEGDGLEGIDTGIKVDSEIGVEMDFWLEPYTSGTYIFGRVSTWDDDRFVSFYNKTDGKVRIDVSPSQSKAFDNAFQRWRHVSIRKGNILLGTKPSPQGNTYDANSIVSKDSKNFYIFGRGFSDGYKGLRIRRCRIYRNNTLVRDFIPVEQGGIGYMFDLVSGNRFGTPHNRLRIGKLGYDEELRIDSDNDLIRNDERLPSPNRPGKNFLDYLYVYEGSTAFKVNEQSDRFGTYNWEHPLNPIDELLYNFRKDQVDLNCLRPWSTYITQTENPSSVNLKSVGMDVVQATNCKAIEIHTGLDGGRTWNDNITLVNLTLDQTKSLNSQYDTRQPASVTEIDEIQTIKDFVEAGYVMHTWEAGIGNDMASTYQIFNVGDDDDERFKIFDDILKIYAYYQKVNDDTERGYHFDLFFNIQNLLKPPFEYISSVTKQPAPLIPEDSYLYLPGNGNDISRTKSGKLTLYAQMKYLIGDITATVKTIPLVTYDIYNISDDKPKFFIKKLTEVSSTIGKKPIVTIKFEDVEISQSEDDIGVDSSGRYIVMRDMQVAQRVTILYNNAMDNDANRLSNLAFTIVKSRTGQKSSNGTPLDLTLDIDNCKSFFYDPTTTSSNIYVGDPADYYPLRWNSKYTNMSYRTACAYPVEYGYQDSGFVHEDLNLIWTIPAGMNVFELYKKFGCISKIGAMEAHGIMKDSTNARIKIIPGKITISSITGGKKFLGREHGMNLTKYGYILNNVGSSLRKILLSK